MLDLMQILLTVVISVLTVLLTIISIAVFQILKEFKKSIEKINLILDDTHMITNSVARPVEEASEFILSLKKGISFFRNVSHFFKDDKDKEKEKAEEVEEVEDEEEYNEEEVKESPVKKVKKRFFTRKGKSLGKTS